VEKGSGGISLSILNNLGYFCMGTRKPNLTDFKYIYRKKSVTRRKHRDKDLNPIQDAGISTPESRIPVNQKT